MKKLSFKVVSTLVIASSLATNVFASGVNVVVNGKQIEKSGIIIESRTMVPVRGIFEELGYTVDWDNDTKTATLVKDDIKVVMTNGETSFTVNNKGIKPDVPHQIIDSSFMLPLRAVSEAIGAEVDWNADTKTASIKLTDAMANAGNMAEFDDIDLSGAVTIEIIESDDPRLEKIPENVIEF